MKAGFIIVESKPYELGNNIEKYIAEAKKLLESDKEIEAIVLPPNAIEGFHNGKVDDSMQVPYYLKNFSIFLSGFRKHIVYPSTLMGKIFDVYAGKIEVFDINDNYTLCNIKLNFTTGKHKIYNKENGGISIAPLGFDGEKYYTGGCLASTANKVKVLISEFREGSIVIDTDTIFKECITNVEDVDFVSLPPKKIPVEFNSAHTHKILTESVKKYFEYLGIKKAVVGLSGGIDSAVVAAIGVEALGKENVTGLLMPSEFSTEHSVTDAEQLAKNLGIEYHLLPIKSIFGTFNETLKNVFAGKDFDVTEENIQARIRGTLVMSYANKFNAMALNTSNKSELMVGYGTLYGDLVGSIGVIGDVFKTEVYKLAHYINREKEIIPEHILTKAPSAELRPGQKDQDALPEYEVLDKILISFLYVMNENGLIFNKAQLYEQIIEKHNKFYGYEPESKTVKDTLKLIFRNFYKGKQVPPKIVLDNYPEVNLPLLFNIEL